MISTALPVTALTGDDRRSGPHLKRKKQAERPEPEPLFSSQSKRQKVAFDPQVEVRVLRDWNDKPLELVRHEVRQAIENRIAGDSGRYDQLKQTLTTPVTADDAPSTALLHKYVVALMGNVSSLGKTCGGLVHAVLQVQWEGRDDGFVGMYVRLLGAIASAHGGHVGSVLRMLVGKFVRLSASAGRLPNQSVVRRPQLLSRVHQALRYLLKLVPSASGPLASVLASFFPFPTDTTKSHVDYIQNLLRLIKYAPELKGEVISLTIEKLVKIDVQIQVDMEDIEDDLEDALLHDVVGQNNTNDHDESDDSDNASVSSSEMTLDPEEQRLKEIKGAIAKIDAILDLLFEYYTPAFARGSTLEMEEGFEQLLANFSNSILPTYRSRHTQFLLFHFAQVSPSLIDRFASACTHFAFERSRPLLMRHAAAAYLGSFIARGAHVPSEVVREVFEILAGQLDNIRVAQQASCTGPDPKRYGGYYAVAQAMLYIFCFRWRDFINTSSDNPSEEIDNAILDGRDVYWAPGVKDVLARNIYCKLNPLKVCSPVIVSQFARIAHHLRFLYVFPLIETNKRLRLSRSVGGASAYGGFQERETALSAKTTEASLQLDAYFPFDPYQLPRSKRWLEGDYVEWKSIPGMKDADAVGEGAAESEDDEDDEESEDDDCMMSGGVEEEEE